MLREVRKCMKLITTGAGEMEQFLHVALGGKLWLGDAFANFALTGSSMVFLREALALATPPANPLWCGVAVCRFFCDRTMRTVEGVNKVYCVV